MLLPPFSGETEETGKLALWIPRLTDVSELPAFGLESNEDARRSAALSAREERWKVNCGDAAGETATIRLLMPPDETLCARRCVERLSIAAPMLGLPFTEALCGGEGTIDTARFSIAPPRGESVGVGCSASGACKAAACCCLLFNDDLRVVLATSTEICNARGWSGKSCVRISATGFACSEAGGVR